MFFKLIFSIFLVTKLAVSVNQCVQKTYPGSDPRIVCVCNSTYCDEFPPLGTLSPGKAVIYQSSISGKRFERQEGTFTSQTFTLKNEILEDDKTFSVTFDSSIKYQTIIGFGGAFTDATGVAMEKLSDEAYNNIVEAYWGQKGISYSTGRVPVASCDFSTHEYSYCDTPDDFNMTTWKLAMEDTKYKIPLILKAKAKANNDLKLFSTPWSAPGWMKTNGDMKGHGSLKGDIGGQYYQAFALYYYKFFEAYHKNGVDFWGLTVLNEPYSNGDWQIMTMDAEEELIYVKKNLGPMIKENPLTKDIKLMIFDDQRTRIYEYANKILNDPNAAKYVDGVAFHWYENTISSPNETTKLHFDHSDKFILATEACTYYNGVMAGDWSRALQYSYDIITDLQNWVTGWTDWNLVLNEHGGPNWVGNYVDAPIIVSNSSDEFYKQPIYYAMGHYSKFIRPGAQRVDLNIDYLTLFDYLEGIAFVNPNGDRVVVLDNRQKIDTYTIQLKDKDSGKVLTFDMEPRSFATIVWNSS